MNFPQLIIHFLILIEILNLDQNSLFSAVPNPLCEHAVINQLKNIYVAVLVFNLNTFSSMQINWGENPITNPAPELVLAKPLFLLKK
jgi:hypothetical protein